MTTTPDLKAAALALNGSQWKSEQGENCFRIFDDANASICKTIKIGSWHSEIAVADYLVAASPATILALIERLQVAEDAEKDAERYQELRKRDPSYEICFRDYSRTGQFVGKSGKELDTAIDAAIAARRLAP